MANATLLTQLRHLTSEQEKKDCTREALTTSDVSEALTTSNILPRSAPEKAITLPEHHYVYGKVRPVTLTWFYRSCLDLGRLRRSFESVVSQYPVLAGRAHSQPALQIRFEGNIGCPFVAKDLPQSVETELSQLTDDDWSNQLNLVSTVFGQLGFQVVADYKQYVDQDLPLCIVSYAAGQDMSILTLSVAHLLTDGESYFQLVEAWDTEYAKAASSTPLPSQGPEADAEFVDYRLPLIPNLLQCFGEGLAERRHMVTALLPQAAISDLKKRATESAPAGTQVSGHCSFQAWASNNLKLKVAWTICNVRGKKRGAEGAKHKGAASGSMGNGWVLVGQAADEADVGWQAHEIGEALRIGDTQWKEMSDLGAPAPDEVGYFNNWGRLEYSPTFCSEVFFRCKIGPSDLQTDLTTMILYCWLSPQLSGNGSCFMATGLTSAQASALIQGLEAIGAETVAHHTPQQVEATWRSVAPQSITPVTRILRLNCLEGVLVKFRKLWRHRLVHLATTLSGPQD